MRAAHAIADQTSAQIGFGTALKNPATLRELAKLIDEQTAAPEMLDLLKEVGFFSGSLADESDLLRLNDTFAKCREVVAKATGDA